MTIPFELAAALTILLIAEFLKISYLDVIRMAMIPTILYYLALFVMVELDVRGVGAWYDLGNLLRDLGRDDETVADRTGD